MSWFKTTRDLRSTIQALFSTTSSTSMLRRDPAAGLENIRQAMLALTALDPGERAVFLARRIRYASDLQALWFMRGELMALLSRIYGEQVALQKTGHQVVLGGERGHRWKWVRRRSGPEHEQHGRAKAQ